MEPRTREVRATVVASAPRPPDDLEFRVVHLTPVSVGDAARERTPRQVRGIVERMPPAPKLSLNSADGRPIVSATASLTQVVVDGQVSPAGRNRPVHRRSPPRRRVAGGRKQPDHCRSPNHGGADQGRRGAACGGTANVSHLRCEWVPRESCGSRWDAGHRRLLVGVLGQLRWLSQRRSSPGTHYSVASWCLAFHPPSLPLALPGRRTAWTTGQTWPTEAFTSGVSVGQA